MDPLQSVVGAHAEEAVSAPRFFIVPGIKGREEDGDGGQSPRQESPLIDGLPEPIVVSRWPPCCAWQSDKFSLFANFEESTQYLFPSFGSWRFYYMTIRKDWKSDQWRSNSLGCSLGRTTDERTKREKHESFMKALLGSEEVPPLAPVIPGTNCFNPVLEKFWLPWAR